MGVPVVRRELPVPVPVAQKIKCTRYSCKKPANYVTQESLQGHSDKQFKPSKKAKMNKTE